MSRIKFDGPPGVFSVDSSILTFCSPGLILVVLAGSGGRRCAPITGYSLATLRIAAAANRVASGQGSDTS